MGLPRVRPTIDLHKSTRRRAQEISIRKGRLPGRGRVNWAQAEEEIRAEFEPASRRTAIVMRVSGVRYVGEYARETEEWLPPGKFKPGATRLPFAWTAIGWW